MKYMNQLNQIKSDIRISKVGLGTARFGTRIDIEKSYRLLDIFMGSGGTVLDTARNYYEWFPESRGSSEQCIGTWMEDRKNRDKICICTKGGMSGKGQEKKVDLSARVLEIEVRESLEALRTDHINIYLLHQDELKRPVEEIVETMQRIREIGKIDYLGVANWSFDRVNQANHYAMGHQMEPFEIVQTWWSLAEYTEAMWNDSDTTYMDQNMYPYLKNNGLIGMAYTSQCKGFFQKAIAKGLDQVDDFLKSRIVTPANLKKLVYIKNFCIENKVSPTAVVIGYITSNILNGIALVSCSEEDQLIDIMNNADYELPQEIIRDIDRICN